MKVTQKEIVDALRGNYSGNKCCEFAHRILTHGIDLGEPVAWRFFVVDDPVLKPFWTGWFTNKDDVDYIMRHWPGRRYECAYAPIEVTR